MNARRHYTELHHLAQISISDPDLRIVYRPWPIAWIENM